MKRDDANILEVAIRAGFFLYIDLSKEVRFCEECVRIPSQQAIGMTGFFIKKQFSLGKDKEDSVSVLASLGVGSLTLTEDSLVFINSGAIEVVKSGGVEGTLIEMRSSPL